ncbi:DUF6468 domain-containing protein [Rickettsiales endosymbiont of Stachyamoeba lipophora]|uniref:DUF6468 domain-containing protein n=1 Tax=Rickettsiales endosymbiont of Stachyamoeba lipophora TaxID=2486578 RepID=UPI000F6469CC|nr:DUF6468 domain-containing protein [Rickettsiales endosymbiont of Stachyamoeba lipophora]AZL15668.1 hypothetical protein EF513_03775 [Rickettsiales endosymbiont of Stachyamoeba lipophora]
MIFVDLFIIIMLVITITFCIKLNKKIELVQKGKKDFAVLFKNFDNTIQRIESSISGMQESAQIAGYSLEEKSQLAKKQIDEIAFLIDKATNTEEKLERLRQELLKLAKPHVEELHRQQNIRQESNNNSLPSIVTTAKPHINTDMTSKLTPANSDQPQNNINDTRRMAIEELLHKISQIQKKAGQ